MRLRKNDEFLAVVDFKVTESNTKETNIFETDASLNPKEKAVQCKELPKIWL